MFWIDWPYIVLVVPMLIISLWAQIKVKTTYHKYSTVHSRSGMTAEVAVRKILDSNGLFNVGITRVPGELTDHYDPRTNTIALSDSVYGSTSVAAIGVAAHEAGHAIQHAVGYGPIKLRTALIPVTNIGSHLSMPLFIIGLLMANEYLAYAGIILFSLTVVFQLVTLPTEFNASRRAVKALGGYGYMNDEELKGTKKVLSAAAMTYLAALFVALASLLRLLLIINGGRRRD
ncbi:MAG: zinc metallopeptidase [Clostridia bacterium]|nr:zinc metallopeptidase [Clostridia bacterium]